MSLLSKRLSYWASWLSGTTSVVLALATYSYTTSTGLAGTSDSFHYMHAAATWLAKGQVLMSDGSPFQLWTPLFPLVLAALGGNGPIHWLNAVALVGVLASWSIVGHWLLPRRQALVLPLLLGVSTPALVVSKFVWSEPLFNLLWAAYFLALLNWLRRGSWSLSLLATALGWLLPMQRLAGVFLLAGVGVGLLWADAAQTGRPSRWARLLHLAGAASGVVCWQLIHTLDIGTASKLLQPMPILADYGFVLGRWLLPLPAASLHALPPLLWASVLVLFLVGIWPRSGPKCVEISPRVSLIQVGNRMLYSSLLLSLLLLIYGALHDRNGADVFDAERYLSPLYPPVMLLILQRWSGVSSRITRYGLAMLLVWLLYLGLRLAHNAYQLRQLPPMQQELLAVNYPAKPAIFDKQSLNPVT